MTNRQKEIEVATLRIAQLELLCGCAETHSANIYSGCLKMPFCDLSVQPLDSVQSLSPTAGVCVHTLKFYTLWAYFLKAHNPIAASITPEKSPREQKTLCKLFLLFDSPQNKVSQKCRPIKTLQGLFSGFYNGRLGRLTNIISRIRLPAQETCVTSKRLMAVNSLIWSSGFRALAAKPSWGRNLIGYHSDSSENSHRWNLQYSAEA